MYIQKYLGVGPELATSYVLLLKSESSNPKRLAGKIQGVRGYSSINMGFEAEIIAGVGSGAALSARMTLNISGTTNSFYAKLVSLTYSSSTYIALALIPTANYNGMSGGIYFDGKTSDIAEIQYITNLSTLSNIVDFPISGGDKTTFTGNVGIGTTSPDAELHVAGTGAIVIPSGTTAQQPTGVTGMIRYNSESAGIEFYNGTVWKGIGSVSATGGNITTSGSYRLHAFTSVGSGSGSFTVTSGGLMDYLIVGGGGGGGGRSGGGGGAGGLVYETSINISPGTYNVIIGDGGTGGPSGSIGSNGSNSSVFGKTAVGGGGGGGDPQNGGSSGGSGGGGRYGANGGGETQTSQGYGFGNAGGNSTGATTYNGGGGGGAGAAGQTGATTYIGDGGVGRQYDISGTNTYYAGGGGGGSHDPWPGSASTGGTGGGGAGGIQNGNGTSGSTNTGGGGGAGSTDSGGGGAGGNGGSGIVIIRYTL
tara:strand:- start:100 stop:1533 length:1434 start_codon:yes stop_codon:yes gene_type:complete